MIYDALHALLTGPNGPLDALYLSRLPDRQVATGPDGVDVAVTTTSGLGPRRYLGERPLTGVQAFRSPTGGPPTDGGVLWWHVGVEFTLRGSDDASASAARAVIETGERLRAFLSQFAGPVDAGGETIQRIEVQDGPHELPGEARRRSMALLLAEVWHAPS